MRPRLRRPRRLDGDSGFTMVLLALMMVVLLIFVALVVDLGNAREEQRQAQAVADSAALSGAAALSDSSPDPIGQSFYFAFKSMALPPPTLAQRTSCGTGCQSYTDPTTGKTMSVTTPWQTNANWVHVKVCWNQPARFSGVIGQASLQVCGTATAKNANTSGGSGGGGNGATSCTANELTITSPAGGNPIGTSGTLSAAYSASQPIDPASIVFIAPNASGVLVRLAKAAGGYTLTYGSGNNATISYTLPAGLSTATGSLFVYDLLQNNCGEVAWSSCPVSTHDNFFETNNGTPKKAIADHGMNADGDADDAQTASQRASSALIADADDDVLPTPGTQVSAGATVGATFHDEHPIDPSHTYLYLNGVAKLPGFNPAPPANNVDAPPTGIGKVSPKVSQISDDGQGGVTVTVTDYLGAEWNSAAGGSPIQGKTIQLQNISSGTVSPASAVTKPDGTVVFQLSDTSGNATYTVRDLTDGVTIVGGSNAVDWPNGSPTDGKYYIDSLGVTLTTANTNGWNSAFIYTYDSDRNQSGGDCSLIQYAFQFTGGVGSSQNSVTLIQ